MTSTADLIRLRIDVDTDEGCWTWRGPVSPQGYGRTSFNGKLGIVHRVSYETFVGPIPEGMHIDHVCHNRAARSGKCAGGATCTHRRCVNPAHLEPVEPRVNIHRSPVTPAAINGAKTTCHNGHALIGDNVYWQVEDGRSKRNCKTCRSENVVRWFGERRAKAAAGELPGNFDGRIMRLLRQERGLYQQDIYRQIPGLTRSVISRYETNQCAPSAAMLAAIASVLGVDPSELTHQPTEAAA